MQEDQINGKSAPLSGGMPPERGAEADPEVVARPTRRRFSADEKARIVREADACTERGAIHFEAFQDNHWFEFQDCVFWANSAIDTSNSVAGGISLQYNLGHGAYVRVQSSTFANNYSNKCFDGQAIYCGSYCSADITNSILFGNWLNCSTALPLAGPGTWACAWCDVEGGAAGGTNIGIDPMFKSPGTGRLRLKSGSPCIDSGNGVILATDKLDLDDDGITAQPLPVDVEGLRRVFDVPPPGPSLLGVAPPVDMGAFEY